MDATLLLQWALAFGTLLTGTRMEGQDLLQKELLYLLGARVEGSADAAVADLQPSTRQ